MKSYKDDGFSKLCNDVSYGFYGRNGGMSSGIYSSLNCAYGTDDNRNDIAQNRKLIAKNLGATQDDVSTSWQYHSSTCLSIKSAIDNNQDKPKADALVTDVAGLPIGVLTADCAPVLFVGLKNNGAPIIGAAHAGWGGALGGILEATVDQMVQTGAMLDTIAACVGPCIMQSSYEVTHDFMKPFVIKHDEAERFFMAGAKMGHLQFDLSGYAAFRLSLYGVKTVRLMGLDTYKNENEFFSYRRSTHKGEENYGRQLSAIMIKDKHD